MVFSDFPRLRLQTSILSVKKLIPWLGPSTPAIFETNKDILQFKNAISVIYSQEYVEVFIFSSQFRSQRSKIQLQVVNG